MSAGKTGNRRQVAAWWLAAALIAAAAAVFMAFAYGWSATVERLLKGKHPRADRREPWAHHPEDEQGDEGRDA